MWIRDAAPRRLGDRRLGVRTAERQRDRGGGRPRDAEIASPAIVVAGRLPHDIDSRRVARCVSGRRAPKLRARAPVCAASARLLRRQRLRRVLGRRPAGFVERARPAASPPLLGRPRATTGRLAATRRRRRRRPRRRRRTRASSTPSSGYRGARARHPARRRPHRRVGDRRRSSSRWRAAVDAAAFVVRVAAVAVQERLVPGRDASICCAAAPPLSWRRLRRRPLRGARRRAPANGEADLGFAGVLVAGRCLGRLARSSPPRGRRRTRRRAPPRRRRDRRRRQDASGSPAFSSAVRRASIVPTPSSSTRARRGSCRARGASASRRLLPRREARTSEMCGA